MHPVDTPPAAGSYEAGTVRALLATDLVTPATREVLRNRLGPPAAAAPRFFDAHSFATLRAACARLLPQPERACPIDLAADIDRRLAEGESDGWRYADMPRDGEARVRGLRGLDESARVLFGATFISLAGERQDVVLRAVQRDEAPGKTWSAMPARRFFEELLAEAAECYYSHPLAQEEIGYAGMADAHGWQAIGLNELHAREPRAKVPTNE